MFGKENTRPEFPKRAVITAGMPYGNKELHFGHIGGVFVHADTFARFLRDRIGEENVIFVSGTDCYGSPILESYRKLKEEKGADYSETIKDYVRKNHNHQKETLAAYEISLSLYAASALDRAGEIHKEMSQEIFDTLYKNGFLEKLATPQFFDPDFGVFLNGRQVIGNCPIEGCASEKAYADECSLGHQYMPSELLNPKSTLSGKTPEVKEVANWYFKLEEYTQWLLDYVAKERKENTRKYIIKTIEEFLKPPCIYVKKSEFERTGVTEDELNTLLPEHELSKEDNKSSVTYLFQNLGERDSARDVLNNKGIRFRTGKTLVPFRLSGNIEWGVPVPDTEDMKDLTFWVWPESLWAPISFTKTYLEMQGKEQTEWKNWWESEDAKVYQFIGEDNIYFYGNAEMALFSALKLQYGDKGDVDNFIAPQLIANRHILFMDKKAGSSSAIKPPMARDLLEFYTPEQLRIHFLSLGLSQKSVSFKPQVYLPEAEREGVDPVLKEGNLLTNVFNRLVRSCFYTAQKYYDSKLLNNEISEEVRKESEEAVLTYERHMYNHEFHSLTYVLDSYIRFMNKYWVNKMRTAETTDNDTLRRQVLADSLYGVRIGILLLHPIAPTGCEKIREYLKVDEKIWNWDYAFSTLNELVTDKENHSLKFLEPKEDFFEKHSRQLEAYADGE
ncbi:class I tRNA ligase family protein [Anaerocolumna chitinilytica]|uniref:Methionyl/Leucyl tRNA synthetase domain-containing protein n=1 Tax=Anaerocolumna chitinilytica TaxID=1727145 RepID=A0A7I8DNV7_9FIRM|nr:class I tRNA ligase family protein [Anaerocolumna chitinilytica]BCK00089.1 hypothetical protein bsdcttw_31290 [Anaerocolumna chitinilytica]